MGMKQKCELSAWNDDFEKTRRMHEGIGARKTWEGPILCAKGGGGFSPLDSIGQVR